MIDYAYDLGYTAYNNCVSINSNPFEGGSPEAIAYWRMGWRVAEQDRKQTARDVQRVANHEQMRRRTDTHI